MTGKMALIGIVEAFMKHVRNARLERGVKSEAVLIPKLTVTEKEGFRAYKEFNYELIYVNGNERHQVLCVSSTARCVSEEDRESIVGKLEYAMVKALFDLMGTDIYEEIVDGTYYKIWN